MIYFCLIFIVCTPKLIAMCICYSPRSLFLPPSHPPLDPSHHSHEGSISFRSISSHSLRLEYSPSPPPLWPGRNFNIRYLLPYILIRQLRVSSEQAKSHCYPTISTTPPFPWRPPTTLGHDTLCCCWCCRNAGQVKVEPLGVVVVVDRPEDED